MTIDTPTRSEDSLRLRYLDTDTANVADILDELGFRAQVLSPEFAPFPPSGGKLAGWAHTIQGEMRPYALDGKDPEKMAACAELQPGSVAVWAGAARGVCCFGELIAVGMKERGCVGALVDGGVRDVAWIEHHGFPVYARYRTPAQAIGHWKVTHSGEPVVLPGATTEHVRVEPGDFVLADGDGALVVPASVAVRVLERAEELGRREVQIRRELSSGLSLADALAKFGHV